MPLTHQRTWLSRYFYTGFLSVLTLIYGALSFSWFYAQTPGRIAGLEWVNFLGPDLVGVIWLLGSLAALVGAITASRTKRRPQIEFVAGLITIAVPLLLGLFFYGSTVVFYLNGLGTPFGWVTGVSYSGYCLMSVWAFLVQMSLPKYERI